jgi:hypothetical protein
VRRAKTCRSCGLSAQLQLRVKQTNDRWVAIGWRTDRRYELEAGTTNEKQQQKTKTEQMKINKDEIEN